MPATVSTDAQLGALYGKAGKASLVKEAARVTSPFATLATIGSEGIDW